jgi:ABC-2 type transport system permease protein
MMELDMNITGLRTMFQFSVHKLLMRRKWVLVLALTLLVGAVMGYGASQSDANIDTASNMMELLPVTFLLPILALIYGASMIRNEIDDRSIIQVITAPLDRRISYMGYYLALTVVLAVLLSLMVLVGGACFFIINGSFNGAAGLIMGYMLLMCIGAIIYSALFLAMGVLLKQPIYLGLFYVFVWEDLIGTAPGAIGQYTIRHQLLVIGSGLIDNGNIASVGGDGVIAIVVLIVLTIVLVTVGAWAFRNKEVA